MNVSLLRLWRNLRQCRPPGCRQYHHPVRAEVQGPARTVAAPGRRPHRTSSPRRHRRAGASETRPVHVPTGRAPDKACGGRSCRRRPRAGGSRPLRPVRRSQDGLQQSANETTTVGQLPCTCALCRVGQPAPALGQIRIEHHADNRRDPAGKGEEPVRSSERAGCYPSRPGRCAAKKSSSPILPGIDAGSTHSHRSRDQAPQS